MEFSIAVTSTMDIALKFLVLRDMRLALLERDEADDGEAERILVPELAGVDAAVLEMELL